MCMKKVCLCLTKTHAALSSLLACYALCFTGCVTYLAPLRGYQCEIAWHNYNPREHDAHIGLLENLPAPIFEAKEMTSEDMLTALNEMGISCSTVYTAEARPNHLWTIPNPKGGLLPFIDAFCATNALYWMTCNTNELFLLPTNQINNGYVHVLPGNANWTNAISREFLRELVREGESPVARNKTVRIMEHETFPDVRFVSTPLGEAVAWLCRQREVPLIFFSEIGVPRYPVSLDMANASLFTALDEICRQSRNYWGFVDGRLAIVSSEAFITNDRWRLPYPNTDDHDLRQGQTYKRELVRKDYNPVLRDKLHFLVNDGLIPSVNLIDMPVMDAIYWLSKQCAQSYSARFADENATNRVVNLSMTNVTFLAAFDEVCEQSDWYWVFFDRRFMTFPAAHLEQETNHPSDTGWTRIQDTLTE